MNPHFLCLKPFKIIVCAGAALSLMLLAGSGVSGQPNKPIKIIEKTSLISSIPATSTFYAQTLRANYPVMDSVAYAVKMAGGSNGVCVFLNKDHGPVYENISSLGPVFSPDGKRNAYIARLKNNSHAVIDGRQSEAYDSIANIVFNHSGSTVAYLARDFSKNHFIVINGEKGKNHTGINGNGYPLFSPDDKTIVYPAFSDKSWQMVVNGKEQDPFEEIRFPGFSPDSRFLCYTGKRKNLWHLVRNGLVVGPGYDDILSYSFSPDSKRIAYRALKSGKQLAIIDDTALETWDLITQPVFSPDSKHFIYAARKGDKSCVITDDKKGSWFKDIGPYQYSPDSRHFSYVALSDKTYFVVTDSGSKKEYESVSFPVYSPDSSKMAYKIKKNTLQHMVINDVELNGYDTIATFLFSPDSLRHAYVAQNSSSAFVVVDGKESKHYEKIGMLAFSPDSRHIVYQACRGDQWMLVVDGVEGSETFKGFLKNVPILFLENRSFRTLAIRDTNGPEIFKVDADIVP